MKTPEERWEQGIPHDPRSEEIAYSIRDIDRKFNNNVLNLKFGGDGDGGEPLLYLLDCYFERLDKKDGKK